MSDPGGTITVNGATYWLTHEAYLQLQFLLSDGATFTLCGETIEGHYAQAWIGDKAPALNAEITPDPNRPDALTAEEEDSLRHAVHFNRARREDFAVTVEGNGSLSFGQLGA